VVGAVDREAGGEARRAVGAPQHALQAGQRLGVAGEVAFDRRLRAEGAEERGDAHQHQRLDHRLGVGEPAVRALRGRVDQHLQRHQRIAPDDLGDAARVDVVLDLAQVLEGGRGAREDGDVALPEPSHPALDVVRRAGKGGGGQGAHGESRGPVTAPRRFGTISYTAYRHAPGPT